MIDTKKKIARSPELLETSLDNEIVLMSIERGNYYGLKTTARRIWQLIEEPTTFQDLITALTNEYAASPEEIEQDLYVFLQRMLDNKIVVLK